MKTFISPKPNRFFFWIAENFNKGILKALQNITEVEFSDEDKEMIRSFKDKRFIFVSNHPSTAEPPLTFLISKVMGDRFRFMASRQVFTWSKNIIGFLIRRIGAYSIIAGIYDKESIKMSRSILAEEKGKLVIFPEGEPTSGENDTLMPFQPGIAQLGLWGLEDAKKKDPDADIVVLTGYFKYRFIDDKEKLMNHFVDRISKIEKKIKVVPKHEHPMKRLMTVARVLLEEWEEKYNITPDKEKGYFYRLGRVRHQLLDNVAVKLKANKYDQEENSIQKFRRLFSIMELLMIKYDDPKLPKLSKKEIKTIHKELVAAFDFAVFDRDYLLQMPTAERMSEFLDRLESLVFNKVPRALGGEPSKMPRKAEFHFSKPFMLSEYYTTDRKEKKKMVQGFMDRIYNEIKEMQDKTIKENTPIIDMDGVEFPHNL